MLTKLITALAIVAAGLLMLLVWRNEGFDNGVTVILILLLITLVYNWLAAMLFRRLKKNHPAKYRELGEPRMLQPGSLRNYWTLMRFMFTAEHKALNDAMVSRLVIIMRALWIVTLGVVIFVATAERFLGFEARTKNHAITDTETVSKAQADYAPPRKL